MILVKPGIVYLDIIDKIKKNFNVPIIAYQVSGEYSALKHAIKKNSLKDDAVLESLISFKRAGACAIVSYFALDIAKKIKQFN